jgi:membrane fusion protein (multidrug efflux system)
MIGSKANMGSSFLFNFRNELIPADLKIKSGMFGKVNLTKIRTEKGIIIPSSAIISTANQTQVYVVKNGKAVLQTLLLRKKHRTMLCSL